MECLGESPPFRTKNWKKNVVVFYNIKNYPLIFFQNTFQVPLLRMSGSAFGSPFLDQTSENVGCSSCAMASQRLRDSSFIRFMQLYVLLGKNINK